MIIGIGTDIVDIRRIARVRARRGARFLERVFCRAELEASLGRADPDAALAKRFAAKEAAAKALGSGFRDGVGWLDICLDNDELNRPRLRISGGGADRLARITPQGLRARVHVSLSDEPPHAQALVIIEAL